MRAVRDPGRRRSEWGAPCAATGWRGVRKSPVMEPPPCPHETGLALCIIDDIISVVAPWKLKVPWKADRRNFRILISLQHRHDL